MIDEMPTLELRELESGQLVISADVEVRGQLAFEELALDPEPAPLNHVPEHPADDLRRELEKEG